MVIKDFVSELKSAPPVPEDDAAEPVENPVVSKIFPLLVEAATSDDVLALKEHLTKAQQNKLSLSQGELRSPENNATVLHIALENNSMQVVKFLIKSSEETLLEQEYDVFVRGTPSKKTVLHLLCEKGNLDLIKIMLQGIKPGKFKEAFLRKTVLTEIQGQRPRHLSSIHIAAMKGCTDLVDYLVYLGIDVNFTNNKGDTPVLWAARWNHLDTARSLIRRGADLQHQNDKGSSPLYWAVRYGFKEMVELLITEGKADVHQQRKLGLFSPIVLASALGHAEITEVLLQNGANVNIKVSSGFTPLHYAAMEGNTETARVLIRQGAYVDTENDAGDSPLLVAVKAKQSTMVDLLTRNGAELELRNKEGKTVWDYAMKTLSTEFFVELVSIYKRLNGLTSKLTFAQGKTPLHKAALTDDYEKLECLFSLGAVPDVTDEGGNTFLHLAARENCITVLKTFYERVDVNCQNSEGDTPLHLASNFGHREAVDILLKKSQVGLVNDDGETALHTACKSRLASAELVDVILDTIAKAHNWSLVSSTDKNGNTALHIAARSTRYEIFPVLKQVNPHLKNNQGDCAQHVVVRVGQRDVLDEYLKVFRRAIQIDQPNRRGDTVLHIAARQCSPDMVELLIDSGADLTAKNNKGNTPVHELILASAVDRENTSDYLVTLDAIHDNVIYWWCMRNDQHTPDDESELYLSLKRKAYVLLTSEIYNMDGYTALNLAAKHGAKSMFERILQTPDVYMFSDDKDTVTFDVTKLTRDTTESNNKRYSSGATVTPHMEVNNKEWKGSVQENNKSNQRNNQKDKVSAHSCLGLIVRSPNIRDANDMLDVIPLKQMVSDYWAAYKWLYGLLMVLHIIYMGLLSTYGIELIRLTLQDPVYKAQSFPSGLLLIWPVLLLLHMIFTLISGLHRRIRGIQETEPAFDDIRDSHTGVVYIFYACVSFLSYYMSNLTQVAFATLVIIWYVLYLLHLTQMAHVMAAAIIFGWLFTIVFTPGFEAVHSYSIMIKSIFLKDISRFLFLYIFVLLAFSFALQTLMYLAPEDVQGEYPTSLDIIFAVFNMMIGMYDPFTESIAGGVDKYGKAALWIKLTYTFYIVFTTIILLNLLIAMMTDSYADVKANEGSTWRVSSVGMALNIDTNLPVLPKLLRYLGVRKYTPRFDTETKRWMMTIPKSAVDMDRKVAMDKTSKALSQLQRDINRVNLLYVNLETKIDALITAVGQIHSDGSAEGSKPLIPMLRNRRISSAGRFKNLVHRHLPSLRET